MTVRALMASARSVGSVVVNGPLVSLQEILGLLTNSGVSFQTDGGVDNVGPLTSDKTAFASGEWWDGEPDAGVGSRFDVRCASISVGSWFVQAASVGAWVQISSERIWRVNVTTMNAPDVSQCIASFEMRPTGGGPTLATFTVNATASN